MKQNLDLTEKELRALYKILKEHQENAPGTEEEQYNDYYDEYETPIGKKTIVGMLRKIHGQIPEEDSEEMDRDFLRRKYHPFNNNLDYNTYAALKKALSRLRTVEMEYFNAESAQFKKRKVDVYYTSSKYTIGYCHLRKDMRKFRTDKIRSVKMTSSTYRIPKGFNKNDY